MCLLWFILLNFTATNKYGKVHYGYRYRNRIKPARKGNPLRFSTQLILTVREISVVFYRLDGLKVQASLSISTAAFPALFYSLYAESCVLYGQFTGFFKGGLNVSHF